ncbi:potassium channel family protein [uncultured Thiodictyon sp.]|uniref:potassium channel family protein n=1 Tax=uncultured Thiodictyon sp. TaxID=1846217 RepID=UPI0025DF4057|nr:potassium channel family protein [uncultured Thiodictyon sp.]
MTTDADSTRLRHPVRRVYALALLLALGLFYFHVVAILDVAGEILRYEVWLLNHLGPHGASRVAILGSFVVLFVAHLVETLAWGMFLRWGRLSPTVLDGFYYTAASITTLGYGDVVLPQPWRHLGPLVAISGVLMFGCSTAFLFVVLQTVWTRHW